MPTVAEITLSYKPSESVSELPRITCLEDAAAYCRSNWDDDLLELREQFIVVLLNNQKRVLGWHLISSGGTTATIVEIAAIYQAALLGNAHSLILSHSHPSGNPKNPPVTSHLPSELSMQENYIVFLWMTISYSTGADIPPFETKD